MKPLILLVEDEEALLEHTRLILENNDYRIIAAKNGVEALEILKNYDQLPDLILCDIMMPEMNGYDLFKKMIDNPDWNLIPFIFLTVKNSAEDVRFGKMLGVDDYLAKPVSEMDLLASIAGKLNRGRRHNILSRQIRDRLNIEETVEISSEDKKTIIVFWVIWDDKIGPHLKAVYPKNTNLSFSVESIGIQLFQAAGPMFGTIDFFAAQGVLFRVANIDMDGYLFFSTIDDEAARGGKRQIMIATLSQRINYFESLRISEVFEEFLTEYTEVREDTIKELWERIREIMTPL